MTKPMSFERFGLSHAPFGGSGPNHFAKVPSRRAAVDRLQQALIDGQGIVLLTGGAGLGKTAILQELEQRLREQWLVVTLRDAGYTSRRSLLQAILYELGLPYSGLTEQEARLRLLQSVRDRYAQHAGLILLADEAQQLSDRLLEELRSLLNHDEQGHRLFRLLLCGDLVLEERLISPALDSINQRIVLHETVGPLSHEESAQLIDELIIHAGGDGWEHVFTRPAIELLCLVCDGSPRHIEQLGKRSLQIALEQREAQVSVESVRKGLNELKELPLHWNEPANLEAYSDQTSEDDTLVATDDHDYDPNVDETFSVTVGDLIPDLRRQDFADAMVIEVGGTPNEHDIDQPAAPPVAAENDSPPSAFIEVGGDDVAWNSDRFLGQDQVEPGQSELAQVDSLEATTPDEHHVAEGDDEPQPVGETSYFEPPCSEAPSTQTPGWIELEVDDPYAALDDGRMAVGSPVAKTESASLREARPVFPGEAAILPKGVSGQGSSPAPVMPILEEELLNGIQQLSESVQAAIDSRGAGSRNSFAPLPEWDVVQPDWIHRTDFTPVQIDTSHDLGLAQDEATQSSTEPGRVDDAASTAPDPQSPLEMIEPAAALAAEPDVIDTVADAPEPEADHQEAVTVPFSSATDAHSAHHVEAGEGAHEEARHRLDDAGQRPYSQLFSRLRKLRSSFRQRSAAGPTRFGE